jgi:hypothetical protein
MVCCGSGRQMTGSLPASNDFRLLLRVNLLEVVRLAISLCLLDPCVCEAWKVMNSLLQSRGNGVFTSSRLRAAATRLPPFALST